MPQSQDWFIWFLLEKENFVCSKSNWTLQFWPVHAVSSSSNNFIPNRIQQYNTVCMTNITNNRVIIDIVMWFCWWPPEKPCAYQAGNTCIQWTIADDKTVMGTVSGMVVSVYIFVVFHRPCYDLTPVVEMSIKISKFVVENAFAVVQHTLMQSPPLRLKL